jgi:hypothetical protein
MRNLAQFPKSAGAAAFIAGAAALSPMTARAQLELGQFGGNVWFGVDPGDGGVFFAAEMWSLDSGWHSQYFDRISVRILEPATLDENIASIHGTDWELGVYENIEETCMRPGNILPYAGNGIAIQPNDEWWPTNIEWDYEADFSIVCSS